MEKHMQVAGNILVTMKGITFVLEKLAGKTQSPSMVPCTLLPALRLAFSTRWGPLSIFFRSE